MLEENRHTVENKRKRENAERERLLKEEMERRKKKV